MLYNVVLGGSRKRVIYVYLWLNCVVVEINILQFPFSQTQYYIMPPLCSWGFPAGSNDKESAFNARDPNSIPGLERFPGEGNVNLLQYSCLGNSIDIGAFQAIYSSWDCKESDTTEQLTLPLFFCFFTLCMLLVYVCVCALSQ